MNAKNISKARNRHQSAVDTRGSATGVGIVGVSLLALVLGFIIVMDAATLVSHILLKIRHQQKSALKVRKSKSFQVKHEDAESPRAQESGAFHSHVSAASSLDSDVSNGDLAQKEVTRFVESVAMAGCQGNHGSALPQHRGSRRKHLLHVRPETILLHVPNTSQGGCVDPLTRKDSHTD